MKTLWMGWILGLLAASLLPGTRAGGQEKPPAAETAKPAAPVAADDAFSELLDDYRMIVREIGRLEAATGTVEIPVSIAELRQRAELKLGKLRAWMKNHGVGESWTYDAARRVFAPPAGAANLPAPSGSGQAKRADSKP